MGRSGGFGYNPSQSSTSMPGNFDEEQMAVARKRLMLQQLSNAAPVESGYKGAHWVNPYYAQLASGVTQAFGQNEQSGLDQQLADIAQRRGAAQQQAVDEMPADIPGSPGSPAINPSMPQPGMMGPPTPSTLDTDPYAVSPDDPGMVPRPVHDFTAATAASPMIPATVKDWAAWGAKNAGISPMMADAGKEGLKLAMATPEKARLAKEAQDARAAAAKESMDARAAEAERNRTERARLAEVAAADKMQMQEYRAIDRESENAQRAADRAALKAMGGGEAKGTFVDAGVSEDGNPVLRNSKGTSFLEIVDGTPVPYAGKLEQRGAVTKGAQTVREADKTIERADEMLKMLDETPGAFGGKKALIGKAASAFPDAVEGAVKEKMYTPKELKAQAYVGREGAQILKDLYGAAVTKGEGGRASAFEYKQGDPPEKIAANIRAIREILASKTEAQSPASRAVARGAAKPTTSSDGWGTPTKR